MSGGVNDGESTGRGRGPKPSQHGDAKRTCEVATEAARIRFDATATAINLEIVSETGYTPMTQPVIFMDPPDELVEEAMGATDKWAYFTDRVMSAAAEEYWETYVMGSEIRPMEISTAA
jgi:hypothetical protein